MNGPLLFLAASLALAGQVQPADFDSQAPVAASAAPATSAPSATPPIQNPTSNDQSPAEQAPPEQPADDKWLVMKTLEGTALGDRLQASRIQISGWTDLSFTASSDQANNGPLGFNYKANQFLLDQNWLRVEQTVDTESKDATYGFRIDTILPGSDYRFTLARGLFSGQLSDHNGQPNLYGFDPIQFYTEAYFPSVAQGMDVKIGHFFCIYGVETNDAISNALFSHAYTFVYDPFTHTGILTTTKLSDAWTVQAGLTLGSDVFIDPADTPTFCGSVKWTGQDQKDTVLFNVIAGSGRFNQDRNFHNPEVFDLIYTHKFSDKLNYNLEGLFGFTTNVPNIGDAQWFGVIHYLTYECTPRVSTTARLEFFDDVQGQRTGFAGLYTALTGGVSFKLSKSILLRPELRYDNNGESRPFEDKHWLFTAATDLIWRW